MGRCFVKSDYSNEPSISSQFSRALSVAFVCCFGELPFPFQPKYLMTPDLLSCNFLVRYFFQSYLFLIFVLPGVTRIDVVYLAGLTALKLDEQTLSGFFHNINSQNYF